MTDTTKPDVLTLSETNVVDFVKTTMNGNSIAYSDGMALVLIIDRLSNLVSQFAEAKTRAESRIVELEPLEKNLRYEAQTYLSDLSRLRKQSAALVEVAKKWRKLTTESSCLGKQLSEVEAARSLIKEIDALASFAETEAGERTSITDSKRLNWLDQHCAFVADSEYALGPYKIGELRKLADAGILTDKIKSEMDKAKVVKPTTAPRPDVARFDVYRCECDSKARWVADGDRIVACFNSKGKTDSICAFISRLADGRENGHRLMKVQDPAERDSIIEKAFGKGGTEEGWGGPIDSTAGGQVDPCDYGSDSHNLVPTENTDPRHAAISNLAFLLSVIRSGEQLSEAEKNAIRKTIENLKAAMIPVNTSPPPPPADAVADRAALIQVIRQREAEVGTLKYRIEMLKKRNPAIPPIDETRVREIVLETFIELKKTHPDRSWLGAAMSELAALKSDSKAAELRAKGGA